MTPFLEIFIDIDWIDFENNYQKSWENSIFFATLGFFLSTWKNVARNLKMGKMLQSSFALRNRPKCTFFKYFREFLEKYDCCKANVARILKIPCNILLSNFAQKKPMLAARFSADLKELFEVTSLFFHY